MDRPRPSFEPLVQTIVRRLHAAPGCCAIRFCDATITNAALLRMILRIAEHLPDAGIGHGTRIGVCSAREPGIVALILALWLRGAVYVPLDHTLPRERLFAMCNTAELDLVIAHSALQATLNSLPCAVVTLDTPPFAKPEHPLPGLPAFADVEARDLAYILFTSGSSGVPKGVKIAHGNIATLFAAILPLLDLTDTCRILGCANFSFDIAFFELLAPLLCGGVLVLADKQACAAPQLLVQLVNREQVNVVQATPSHWQLLNALPWASPLHVAIATGEALSRATAAGIAQHATTLWNLYGPTECTIWSSAHRVDASDLGDEAPAIVSIGSALPGYRLQLHPTEDAKAGELVISGTGVGQGYCGEPEPGAAFCPSPEYPEQCVYYSGDLCRRDAEGLLHYLGRKDNQVKHNGYRIELDEIALVLQRHMSVSQAACLVRPSGAGAPSLLIACVVTRAGMPNKNKTALNDHLATHLPAWMLPQRYFLLEHLPLTTNGKLDRAALLALTDPVHVCGTNGSLESRVAQVFCDVLDIDSIGPCDSFLDVGGSSMLTATLVLTLNERFDSALTLRQALSTPPTVSSIVQLLRSSIPASAAI